MWKRPRPLTAFKLIKASFGYAKVINSRDIKISRPAFEHNYDDITKKGLYTDDEVMEKLIDTSVTHSKVRGTHDDEDAPTKATHTGDKHDLSVGMR